MSRLIPGKAVPALRVPLAGGGHWTLAGETHKRYTVIEFYRGYHCPRCRRRLQEIDKRLDELAERDATFFALSTDPQDRAEKSVEEWELENLQIGYGLSIEAAREWGLYISGTIAAKETELFCEPGLFIVRPDGTLYISYITTAPFLRPDYDALLECLEVTANRDYPPRGVLG